ncbi:MAG: glycosyltransferase [Candidatus Methylacidiphilales bacterium]
MTLTLAHTENSLGWGGQEIRITQELLAMRKRGHRVMLFTPTNSHIREEALRHGITVFPLCSNRLRYPLTIASLARRFRQERVTVVHTHSSRDSYLGGIAARLAGVPLVIRARHIDVDYPNRLVSRWAYAHLPHHVTTTSQKISQGLIEKLGLDPNRLTCIPTGIDLHTYRPATSPVLRSELLTDESVHLVGMISVLRSWKGHRIFLEAARSILDQRSDVSFFIAGEGPMRELIQQWITELSLSAKVKLLGHRDDVPDLLAALDVLVLPSLAHEGIPQIVLQAQACGKAVVGSLTGGIPEVITDGQTGLLAPTGDADATAKAILTLLENTSAREKLGQAARALAETRHGIDRMCCNTEALYDRYLKLPRPSA